jgi:uncharacterized protein YbjT (DUF2867 family)
MHKTALIAGGSGLTGSALIRQISSGNLYQRVTVIGRYPEKSQDGVLEYTPVNFDQLDTHADLFNVDDVYCCLGTTIKKAGSRENFRRVDYEYPLALARLAAKHGAQRFFIITALGADAGSGVFYNRVKGEVERDLLQSGMPEIIIFRPSLLLGKRSEFRLGEWVGVAMAQKLPFLFSGPLRKYRPVHVDQVAAAMLR